ncbi:MAG: DegV family protein [Gammaproteobacteria bacterium]
MPQKIGIVIDSACDLPRSFIEQHGIEIMPVMMRFGHMTFKDLRDPEQTMDFYRRFVAQKELEVSTTPLSTKAIRDLFLDQLVLKYDRVLVVTASSRRSPVFENATQASFMILSGYKERRRAAGLDEQFGLRVIDSKTLFTGQAVVVYEALRSIRSQDDIMFDKLRQHVESFSQHVNAYVIPQDLFYVRSRAHQKGDTSIGWFKYQLGTTFDIKPILRTHRGETDSVANVRGYENAVSKLFEMAIEAIESGLLTKVVCMSYAGNPEVVKSFRGYDEFIQCAMSNKVETLLSVMSTTAGIHVGPGAFSMAYAAR